MNTAVMTERIAEASPRFKARMAGVFYLFMFLIGGLDVFARRGLVVSGDAAASRCWVARHGFEPPTLCANLRLSSQSAMS